MKSTLLYIFLLSSSLPYAQDTLHPHPIDGICPFHAINLKGGFKLYIGDTIGDRRTMRLIWYGLDTIIRSVDLKASNAELGWVAADDDDFFALYSTSSVQYTRRQPLSIFGYRKLSPQLLFSGPLISYDSLNNYILFIEYTPRERMGLFDMQTMKLEYFEPFDTPCESWWWCITYSQVSATEVIIDYRDWKNNMTRKIFTR